VLPFFNAPVKPRKQENRYVKTNLMKISFLQAAPNPRPRRAEEARQGEGKKSSFL
jgi:hypothetical protein